MRRQLTAYLTDEQFNLLRTEADERGITLSRYVKERLCQSDGSSGLTFADATLASMEKRIIEAAKTAAREAVEPLAHRLTLLLALVDQFALSVLSHLPEIPESQRKQALASGQRRHLGLRAEVEETLTKMDEPRSGQRRDSRNGDPR